MAKYKVTKLVKKNDRLTKRTNRKTNFQVFIDSGGTDIVAFRKACKNDENLLIYTCLTSSELQVYIDHLKTLSTVEDQLAYLINNQPLMNETIERFERCVESIAYYLKNYIEYNGFKMANADGDYEDWTSEFWLKYTKICEFYRLRWFFPETLKKESTVVWSPLLYKEFIYICRMSITGERKNQAFLATQNAGSSLFKTSLDRKLDRDGDNDKTLIDTISDQRNSSEVVLDQTHVDRIMNKALDLCKQYPDAEKHWSKIKTFYTKQDTVGFDKKTVILGKIFLYKAGLVSPKILVFIKALSTTYKARYNISPARVNTQLNELKNKKTVKLPKRNEVYVDANSAIALAAQRRGEFEWSANA